MSKLVVCIPKADFETHEKKGRVLYKNNNFYKNISNLMEHPEFRELFDNHFKDINSIQVILMFLKVYESIEAMSPISLSGYQKLSVLDKIFKDKHLRKELVDQSNKFMFDQNKKLLC